MKRASPLVYLPAALVALAILAVAPYMSLARKAAKAALADGFATTLSAALVAVVAFAFLAALVRIREYRTWRYLGLVLVAALLLGAGWVFRREDAAVSLVEKIHLVQYGLLAGVLYLGLRRRGLRSVAVLLGLPVLGAFGVGAADETVQWYVPVRTGDVFDVILNAYGALCGAVFALSLAPPAELAWWRPGDRRRLSLAATVVVLVVALFLDLAHLGTWVEDGAGRFRSYYDREALLEVQADRARRWPHEPPPTEPGWAHQDPYFVEALWHVNHRNASFQRGDLYPAWKETLLLERFYRPFLDLTPMEGTGNYRLPPVQQRRMKNRRPQPDPYPYVSPVLEGRVWTRPTRGQLWLGAAGLTGVLLLLAGGVRPSEPIRRPAEAPAE